ncbi:hypothetical protein GOODEAATRI_032186, partial [Goodea atripinnis]
DLMAQGKKSFLNLVVLLLRHLYLLPEGMRVNRCCIRFFLSATVQLAYQNLMYYISTLSMVLQ